MQDNFLFDDGDLKQRGHGCDRICANDKQLKYKWKWWKGSPSQATMADLGHGWELETLFWHTNYEAKIMHTSYSCIGQHHLYGVHMDEVISYGVAPNESTPKNKPLLTRLDAQLKAEQMFEELVKELTDILEQAKET